MKYKVLAFLLGANIGLMPGLGAMATQFDGVVLDKVINEVEIQDVDYQLEQIPVETVEVITVYPTPYSSDPEHTRAEEVTEELWLLDGETIYDNEVPDAFAEACFKWGRAYQICPELLEAMGWKEATYVENIKNASGTCWGVMQVNPKVHADRIERLGYEKDDMLTYDACVHTAADYLYELLQEHEEMSVALNYYNGQRTTKDTPYAMKILNKSYKLEELHGKHDM